MKYTLWIGLFMLVLAWKGQSSELKIKQKGNNFVPTVSIADETLLAPPAEGLWSVAVAWRNGWTDDWVHADAVRMEESGPWTVLYGTIDLPQGGWKLRDAYRQEGNRIRCVRRYEWTGNDTLREVNLSVRWQTPCYTEQLLMPAILYYGNPSGYRNGGNMPTFNKENAPEAIFEEHRFSMPFVSAEIERNGRRFGAALHTLPSQAQQANIRDQWWSLGAVARENGTELTILSGPIAYNGKRAVAKALQSAAKPYNDTYLNIAPGSVIEKTFFLEAYPVKREGAGFLPAIETSLDLFRPYYTEDMPSFQEIIDTKYAFSKSRYYETDRCAGFGIYELSDPKFVFGWCGQAAAPGFALQKLKPYVTDPDLDRKVQRSLDFLSETPFGPNGFRIQYDVSTGKWEEMSDFLSQAQGMNNFAQAIRCARKNRRYDTAKWDAFLRKACDFHAERILRDDWRPLSTNEGFLIAPLATASKLFKNKTYRKAAIKAADHYSARHCSMREPYWGGTLDATGEDKEGAWAALQGFLAVYELTKEKKYLEYAEHAAGVVLSYTVVWDIPMPPSRMGDHAFKSRGWTAVSPQNMHLDVYGVLYAPQLYKLGRYLKKESLQRLALLMFRSCGQMIDPFGSHGEQLLQTNYAQNNAKESIYTYRGDYVEHWTVFWVTAHFLNAAAQFAELNPDLLEKPEK